MFLIIAHQRSEYDEYATNDIIGLVTDHNNCEIIIKQYKEKLYKFNSEVLLDNTTFLIKEIKIDSLISISIPSY